ncbi:MAG: hypothetical protein ACM3II_07275 [Rhodospirillaceae bacterium]
MTGWDFVIEVSKVAIGSIPAVGALGGVLVTLHRQRNERFDRQDAKHEEFRAQLDKLDGDFDGLVRQLASTINDVERRFLPRDEHVEAVGRLDATIVELNRNIGTLNTHLFELARERHGTGR